ncbi:LuxR C-terminal-related transcriptional regulator [Actinospongicola halichondriae]|uniref:LuxR C-terminal-related transcriptional regulator n=1 Tax=Actinospongicola halichondriae TaxID=3236844 RepID=UPI003D554313
MTSVLVGRTAESAWLRSTLSAPASAVVITGPAGVGKSRLAREVCDDLEAGHTVLRVFASEAAGDVPFGAFAHVVPPPEFGSPDPTAMLRTATERVLEHYDGDPGVLLVDDAHLLDPSSVALLHHLVHSSALTVVLTVRSGDPAPPDVARLWADDRVDLLELADLDEADTGALVTDLCAGPVDSTTADEIWRATRGNPLFVRELVTAALADRRLRLDEGLIRLQGELRAPDRLTELVHAQLLANHADDFDALEFLAVTGPVDLDACADEVGTDAVDRLERAGVIAVTFSGPDGGQPELRLGHPLYEEALIETMSITRLRSLQRRAAELLSGSTGPAFRYREAMLRIECGLHVDGSVIEHAAHYALACFDRGAAERLVRSAVETETDPSTSIELDRILAKLLRWTGRHDEAEEIFRRTDVATVDDSHVFAEHLIARSENLFRGLLDADAAHALLETAQDVALEDADAERLEAFDASLLLLEARVTEAAAAAETLIGRGSDPAAAAMAAVVLAYAQGRAGKFARAEDAADLAEALAKRHPGVLADDPTAPWSARCLALADSGALDRCDVGLRVGPAGGDSLDRVHWQAWRELITARVQAARGRVSTAVLHARSAALSFRDHEDRALERVAWAGVARIEGQRGVVATEAIERAHSIDPGPFRLLDCEIGWSHAWVAIAEGRITDGVDLLRTAAGDAESTGQFSIALAVTHDMLRVEPDADIATAVEALAEVVGGDLATARSAHARAVIDGDIPAFERAAEDFSTAGAALVAAEVLAQGAAVARAGGDPRRARLLATRAMEHHRRCEDAATPALRSLREPIALTRREREVATQAANGLTGPEIAERLFLSVRTVNNHLQRAYQKLGIESRADLADALQLAKRPT